MIPITSAAACNYFFCGVLQGSNEDYFSQYITEDFREYIRRKSKPWVHGNHIEIQALSEMYSRTIEVLCYSSGKISGCCAHRPCFILTAGYFLHCPAPIVLRLSSDPGGVLCDLRAFLR